MFIQISLFSSSIKGKKYVPLLLSFFFLELLSFPEKAACAPANGKMEVVGDENEKLSDAKENNI